MKKVWFLIAAILLPTGFLAWFFYAKPEKDEVQVSVSPTPFFLETGNFLDFEIEDRKMRAVWEKVDQKKSLSLIPNFEEEMSIDEAADKYQCDLVINAGFYREDKKPLGLFATKEKILSKSNKSSTFNGYFSYAEDGKTEILSSEPVEYFFAFQSGPILIKDSLTLNLQIKNDRQERRMAAAVTKDGELYFIAVFDTNAYFNGPFLSDLPEIIKNVSDKAGDNFRQALNLDGGTASGFYTPDFKLVNLSPIGSFICAE